MYFTNNQHVGTSKSKAESGGVCCDSVKGVYSTMRKGDSYHRRLHGDRAAASCVDQSSWLPPLKSFSSLRTHEGKKSGCKPKPLEWDCSGLTCPPRPLSLSLSISRIGAELITSVSWSKSPHRYCTNHCNIAFKHRQLVTLRKYTGKEAFQWNESIWYDKNIWLLQSSSFLVINKVQSDSAACSTPLFTKRDSDGSLQECEHKHI